MPAYDNFDDAYYNAGVDVYNMHLNVDVARGWVEWLQTNWDDWEAGVWHYWLLTAVNALTTALEIFADRLHGSFSENAFTDMAYWNSLAGGEFDMDTLLSTMLQAEPDQVQYFVGLVDAYRQSIWNQPFNEEFFAALARGFEQWP